MIKAEMCTIVPQGETATYWMGCREDLNGDVWPCAADELEQHPVSFGYGFEMMRSEVTVAMYRACVAAGHDGCVPATTCDWGEPNYDEPGAEQHPVVCVSAAMATAFSQWVGMRLPSEAEWEYASRGPMESADDCALFPWGTDAVDCAHAVFQDCDGDEQAVCSVSPPGDSPFGLCDMAGNVSEWTTDAYHEGYADAPDNGSPLVVVGASPATSRGGSWGNPAGDLRIQTS